ncbi:MAG: hypothetical protein WD847_01090 [Pirellulales bacterium]
MVIRGQVENGVVVLEKGATLPEGTTVLMSPCAPTAEGAMDEERHRAVMEEISRIASLPIEGATDPFSGSDHDRALYGKA